MAPLARRVRSSFVSPHGVHVATFENSGSRAVIYYDGVPGPKFDEILGGDPQYADDGERVQPRWEALCILRPRWVTSS